MLAPRFNLWQKRLTEQKSHLILAWVGMILYALSVGMLVLFRSGNARFWTVMLAAAALLMIGTAFVMIHAFDESESWLPHFFRSFDYALFTAFVIWWASCAVDGLCF